MFQVAVCVLTSYRGFAKLNFIVTVISKTKKKKDKNETKRKRHFLDVDIIRLREVQVSDWLNASAVI